MKKEWMLTFEEAKKMVNLYSSPLMVISEQILNEKVEMLQKHLPQVKICYAMKANPAEGIIKHLAKQGICFDVASAGEMRQLASYGIAGERMVYANPTKTEKGLLAAKECGVSRMTFDSEAEIDKMAQSQPGATVLLRIQINNPDALVDLNSKFGITPEKAPEIWRKAQEAGLDMAGLCFHVGSQSLTTQGYLNALHACRELFDKAAEEGLNFRILDIGGGFPICKNGFTPDVPAFLTEIQEILSVLFPETEIWSEPGRFICGEAATVIASVIGVTERRGKPFYTLDEGVYGAFTAKFFDHWDFEPRLESTEEKEVACLAGPSCDSIDILVDDYQLPPLKFGDLLLFDNAGAYTYASATTFNGFDILKVIMVD